MVRSSQRLKIDELLKFVSAHDGDVGVFAMLDAYLDESGIHAGAEICVIAGFVSGIGQWRKFEKDWRVTLKRFGVPLDKFHAKDLVKRQGFFRTIFKSDAEARSFQIALADVIAAYRLYPVSLGIVIADFEKFNLKQKRFFTGAVLNGGKLITSGCPNKPYFAAFQHCIKRIVGYAPANTKVNLFFGLDRPFAEYATALLRDFEQNTHGLNHQWARQMGVPSFPKASETPQLQAADYLVHLVYLDMIERKKANNFADKSPPYSVLGKCLSHIRCVEDVSYFDRHTLQHLLDQTYRTQGSWDELPE